VILLAVLWQYVKVFLSKHELELHDIGRLRSGSSLCLLTASGSFHEMLGSGSRGLEVDLGKFQEEVCNEQLVSELPIWAGHLQRRFFKFQLFLKQRYGSVMT